MANFVNAFDILGDYFKSFGICGHPTCQHGLIHGVGLWFCGNGYNGAKDQVYEYNTFCSENSLFLLNENSKIILTRRC